MTYRHMHTDIYIYTHISSDFKTYVDVFHDAGRWWRPPKGQKSFNEQVQIGEGQVET